MKTCGHEKPKEENQNMETVGAREPESLESREPEDHESSRDPGKPENRCEPKEF